jgi:hypothetical protein
MLHLTKKDGFLRGSLGTELQNKSDLLIKGQLDEEEFSVSHITCLQSRDARFSSYKIKRIGDTGVPVVCGEEAELSEETEIQKQIQSGDIPW